MSELLSSLDVVNKQFGKAFHGYNPSEVDEFLDHVAESIQSYVQKTKDIERALEEQSEKLRDYETIKNSLHEALLMAQRTAEEKVANAGKVADEKIREASTRSEDILAEARMKADRMVAEAERDVARLADDLTRLKQLRETGFAHLRSFVSDVSGAVARAESGGSVEIPSFAGEIARRHSEPRREEQSAGDDAPILLEHHQASFLTDGDIDPEEKRAELSSTLNALGIDPSLLDSNV